MEIKRKNSDYYLWHDKNGFYVRYEDTKEIFWKRGPNTNLMTALKLMFNLGWEEAIINSEIKEEINPCLICRYIIDISRKKCVKCKYESKLNSILRSTNSCFEEKEVNKS